jgi:nucleotide-binding universal stress UspA family protein
VGLIVMGIHGLGGADRPHIGSTTDRVLRTADVPVLPV